VFPVYFRLSLKEGRISAAEMRALLALSHNANALSAELERLSGELGPTGHSSRVREVLTRMQDYTRDCIPIEHIPNVILALFDAGNALIRADDRVGIFDLENDMRVLRISYQLLEHYPDQQARFEILEEVFSSAKSIPMIMHQTLVLGQEHGKHKGSASTETEKTVSHDQLEKLETLAIERVVKSAQDGQLAHSPQIPFVLGMWEELTESGSSPRQFVEELTASDRGLANFLEGFLDQVISGSLTRSQSRWVVQIPRIQKWTEVEPLKERVESLLNRSPNWMSQRQKLALEVFLDNLEHAPIGYDDFNRPKQP
jgi:predicted KAP-like P-loop ATPase